MDKKIFVIIFAMYITVGHGFGLREIWDFLLGAGYGQYPNYGHNPGYGNNPGYGQYPNYPSGPGLYPGNYPGNYPGSNYPSSHVEGPPGAHPGCPLCDSSVYSYCSQKQAHDSCCCDNTGFLSFGCRKSDCKFLYANSCQEYQLISNCCCIDLLKNSVEPVVPVVG